MTQKDNSQTIGKYYYGITEVSKMLEISATTLRFWEKEFKEFIKLRKTKRGDRHYTKADINKLRYLQHLLKEKKYTLDGARQVLRKRQKEHNPFELIERLENLKVWLKEIKLRL